MAQRVETLVNWVVLTMGDRPTAVEQAIESLRGDAAEVTVVVNGIADGRPAASTTHVDHVIELPANVGVPAGRDRGVAATASDVVAFLDDDAVAPPGATERIVEEFSADDRLGAVSLRLVDEDGDTSRRHVPRPGGRDADRSGEVALFLGGACAIRREAYDDVGGYFTDLFYGHEELELSWRLVERGWKIRYLADVKVFHPKTTIERHAHGWELTGRNRVWIARRTLPWPVAMIHVAAWLVLGMLRAPKGESRKRYLAGWRSGWKADVGRDPIRWRTVWHLARLGRPPII
ncbi:glycosyltransferase family 2 protein [Ilumatobacter coccineus]|uniref:glycosyltransferase family 2 protein n=1 Tax=Ilumatobacter coccineus TaxID=467094 RepID=UPI00059D463A|nr:glycosyltransferase [Ilumatobacter coccineus]